MIYVLSTLLILAVLYVLYCGYLGSKYGAPYLPEHIIEIAHKFSEHQGTTNLITYFTYDCLKLIKVEYVNNEFTNIYIKNMSKEMREYAFSEIEGIAVDTDINIRCRVSHESYLKIIERLCKYLEDSTYPMRISYYTVNA